MDATIAAISTAMSASGIGIVRISGEKAMDVIANIYRSKNGKKDIREVGSHTIHYGFIYDGEEVVDEVLVMIMKGPHTYTGEDTVEIDCHGGVYAMKMSSRDGTEKRCHHRRTGRIYKKSILKRKAGSFAGGGSNGCYSGQKLNGTEKLCRAIKGFCAESNPGDPCKTATSDCLY